MIDDKESRALLALLAWELFGREPDFDPEIIDWTKVLEMADGHALTALMYPGLKRLRGVPQGIVDASRSAAIASAMQWERILSVEEEIAHQLDERKIPCAVLKGASSAIAYPHYELRVPGDIDILVRPEDMESAVKTLRQLGFAFDQATAMHECYHGMGTIVELHWSASVFPDTEKGRFARAYMADALDSVHMRRIGGVTIPTLTGVHQLISLLAHMERHMSLSGIGLRQLCDWAAAIHACCENIGVLELQVLEQCGLLCYAQVITRGCEKYLGLPTCEWSHDVSEKLADAAFEDILNAGNFHSRPGERSVGAVMMQGKIVEEEGSCIIRSYIRYVRHRIRNAYPWAKHWIWVPLFGLYFPLQRYARVLAGKRKSVRLQDAIRTARFRERLIRQLRLYQ